MAYLKQYPALQVPEAMQASKFTHKESCNIAKQNAVCWAHMKAIGRKRKSPPMSLIGEIVAGSSAVSPLTELTMASGSPADPECFSLNQSWSSYGLRLWVCSNGESINLQSMGSRGRQVGMQGKRQKQVVYIHMQLPKWKLNLMVLAHWPELFNDMLTRFDISCDRSWEFKSAKMTGWHNHNSRFENSKLHKEKKGEKRSKKMKSRGEREFLAIRDHSQKFAKK